MLHKALCRFVLMLVICFTAFGIDANAAVSAQIYEMPSNSAFKSWMSYRAITNTGSRQYKLQELCETDDNGLRTYNGYYTVAVGTGFKATVGDFIDVQLSSGRLLHCVIGDIKQNAHTDSTNRQVAHNGNVVEFIVDTPKLDEYAKERGDISVIPGFDGYVEHVSVLGTTVVELRNMTVEKEKPEELRIVCDYLIVGKSEVLMPNGEILYMIDYAFSDEFNNIICSEKFYDSVSVGDIVHNLE